jgi:hypothetical protein
MSEKPLSHRIGPLGPTTCNQYCTTESSAAMPWFGRGKEMKKKLASLGALLGGGLALSACVAPAPYDPSQVNLAIAQQSANTDSCFAKAKSGGFPNVRGFTDCIVSSKSQFVTTIKLKEPGYFIAFTQRMNMIGDQADSGRISLQQASDQMNRVEVDFDQQLAAAYRENQNERMEAAAKMQAFGQAMSNAGASLAASTPQVSPSPTINCTSAVFGGRANGDNRGAMLATNCH